MVTEIKPISYECRHTIVFCKPFLADTLLEVDVNESPCANWASLLSSQPEFSYATLANRCFFIGMGIQFNVTDI